MNFNGLVIGIATFFMIGIFHVVVIKAEYYFSKQIWPLFLAAGLLLLTVSVFLEAMILSCLAAVLGISCLWSIRELFEQEERVRKGWFPQNPKRQNRNQ